MYQNMYYKSKNSFISDIQEVEWRPCLLRKLNERAFGIQSLPLCNNPAVTDNKIAVEIVIQSCCKQEGKNTLISYLK